MLTPNKAGRRIHLSYVRLLTTYYLIQFGTTTADSQKSLGNPFVWNGDLALGFASQIPLYSKAPA
jgi:hypothetical protein